MIIGARGTSIDVVRARFVLIVSFTASRFPCLNDAGKENSMQDVRHSLRPVWFALILLFALAIGVTCGLLFWTDSHRLAAAVMSGGGAFAASVVLGMATYQFLHETT
jgi:hypothetical protein